MLLRPANPFAAGWAETPIILRCASGRVALFLLCFVAVVAQAASTPTTLRLSEYQKQDWQVEDGLPENYVRMITQRPDGVLLLATSSGHVHSTIAIRHMKPAPIIIAT